MLLDLLSLYTRERFQDWDAWGGSWSDAWGNSWGPTNPNSARASLSFGFQVNGTLTAISSQGKSGVSRLWLIDYYTKAFAKPKEAPKPKRKVSRKRIAEVEAQRQQALVIKVERAVKKAEEDIAQLTGTLADAQAAQQFVADLLIYAQQSTITIMNFKAIDVNYRKSVQRDDEHLLLFALGLSPEVDPKLGDDEADLMLLTYVL